MVRAIRELLHVTCDDEGRVFRVDPVRRRIAQDSCQPAKGEYRCTDYGKRGSGSMLPTSLRADSLDFRALLQKLTREAKCFRLLVRHTPNTISSEFINPRFRQGH